MASLRRFYQPGRLCDCAELGPTFEGMPVISTILRFNRFPLPTPRVVTTQEQHAIWLHLRPRNRPCVSQIARLEGILII
ncbi:hypothetical protein ABIA13_006366 [Sinorhizobium fredii]